METQEFAQFEIPNGLVGLKLIYWANKIQLISFKHWTEKTLPNVKCQIRNVRSQMWNVKNQICNVKFEIWEVKCEMWRCDCVLAKNSFLAKCIYAQNVKSEMWIMKCET
jgi:hypothetical protein